ncbi:MAG: 6-phosphogluconolactonase [Planctomycetes bacterium]|nr:6-phosphogluconolactonase [Planctomycetota bacterium]
MSRPEILICRDPSDLAARAAREIAATARAAIAARGRFTLVLSGGSTPEKTYQLLGRGTAETDLDWSQTSVFFGDERFVPPSDPGSNYGMARRTLIERLQLSEQQVFPMPTQVADPAAGAQAYEATLAEFFGVAPGSEPPQLDLVLLGLGDDGHTASLFPGRSAVHVRDRWVTASPPGRLPPPVDRITLTFPILNRARRLLFLVAGQNKAEVVREILEESPAIDTYPAVGIQPVPGTVTWLLDPAAASRLTPR